MFDVLVYLYETYYRPEACPDTAALTRKLSAIGFEDEEISRALGWLTDLAQTSLGFAERRPAPSAFPSGTRIYVAQEVDVLGTAAIGFIQFLESAAMLDAVQREIVVERALAIGEAPVSLDQLKIIVLMVLWSEGKEPDGLMFDELFFDEEDGEPRLLH